MDLLVTRKPWLKVGARNSLEESPMTHMNVSATALWSCGSLLLAVCSSLSTNAQTADAFNPTVVLDAETFAIERTGKILIAGSSLQNGAEKNVVRLNPGGT